MTKVKNQQQRYASVAFGLLLTSIVFYIIWIFSMLSFDSAKQIALVIAPEATRDGFSEPIIAVIRGSIYFGALIIGVLSGALSFYQSNKPVKFALIVGVFITIFLGAIVNALYSLLAFNPAFN